MTIWTGIMDLLANLILAMLLNPVFRRLRDGHDETTPVDYEIEGRAKPIAVAAEQAHRAT